MSIDINKDYGFRIDHNSVSGNYTLRYRQNKEDGNEDEIDVWFDQIGKQGKTEITKEDNNSVSLKTKNYFVLDDFVNFCKEVIKGYDEFNRQTKQMLYCGDCKIEQPYYEKKREFGNGTVHIEAHCCNCDRWLKFIPQDKALNEVVMPFGVYKGKKIVDIPKSYLDFLLGANAVKGNLKNQINEVLYGAEPKK